MNCGLPCLSALNKFCGGYVDGSVYKGNISTQNSMFEKSQFIRNGFHSKRVNPNIL